MIGDSGSGIGRSDLSGRGFQLRSETSARLDKATGAVRSADRGLKLFVLAIGARDRASSRLRVWDHLGWLREQGHDVRADSLAARGAKGPTPGLLARIAWRSPRWFWNFLWCDAAIIQETLWLWPAVLLKNWGKRRRLIFDFSDPVDRIGGGLKLRLRKWMFGVVVRNSDTIIVENKVYLELLTGQAGACRHFYGPVDATRYGDSRKLVGDRRGESRLRIGWTGSPGTYKFIQPIMPIIDELAREHPIEVILIGVKSIDYRFRFARLTLVDWEENAEFATVPTFDLGLFRLDGSDDALWRGAGKLFIYMAAGVPFIANDRGIAQALMKEAEVGFAVTEESEWFDVLHAAVGDEHGRRDMIEKSLAFARDHLSYELYRRQLHARLAPAPERQLK